MTVVHMRAGRYTACPLWGVDACEKVGWVNDFANADCSDCVTIALPFTILPPDHGFTL